MAVISHHFRRKRTMVLTFVASGSSLGSIIHPIMLNNLLNGPVGFANGVRASAGLVSGLLLIACLCMRTRVDPPTIPVNYIVAFRKSIHDLPFVIMVTGGFLFLTGFYYPIFYLQVDSMQHGINTTFSFYSLVILNAANFVGRISSGYISVFVGVPYVTIGSTIACGGVILGMIGLSSLVSVVVIAILYGYLSGVYSAMAAPLLTALTPDMSELGARMGICFCVTGLGLLIGTPISGALLTSNYIWWAPAVFSGVIAIAGGLTFGLMQFMLIRRQAKRDV
ncbi:hypothetical protein AZE42_09318 [Rhizopogon vesiculosus]|uniref:Major facilitator superfamily (MFS) profile domain-containing protein n=1 Tax=Rhizopogon vesiculosus TaxID=180088 RepID=A0A1J8Q6T2_9AGAM|nr:hypothetical protein AZE42_09318 [Rhizopogon vesiculosus]